MFGVALDCETYLQKDLDISVLTSTLPQWMCYDNTPLSLVDERIANAEIVVTNKIPLTKSNLYKASRLRCICVAATGWDHIDVSTANNLGILVCNVSHYSTPSVVQHTIGLLICLASKIADYDSQVKAGAWLNAKHFCLQTFKTMELAEKVLGIVGYGAIGQGVAAVAKQLGMKVLICGRPGQSHPNRLPLFDLLSQVDVLSLHCPLTAETKNLIGKRELAQMKAGALLLNVSRGGLIDENALKEALLAGHLGGAAIDVCAKEPPDESSPLFSALFPKEMNFRLPNLLLTPHIAWATKDSRMRLLKMLADNIVRFLAGNPQNVIGQKS